MACVVGSYLAATESTIGFRLVTSGGARKTNGRRAACVGMAWPDACMGASTVIAALCAYTMRMTGQ